MEDNIQTIIAVIVSVFLLFIFPVYMAYEKKDDISYALAMRHTQDLVDEVRSKGYITKYMYEDYRAKLKSAGNSYDIQMTHEYNRYDPITNYYKIEGNNYVLLHTTTQEERKNIENNIKQQGVNTGILNVNSTKSEIEQYITNAYKSQGVDKVEDTYRISKQIYTTEHILAVLDSERKLLLNSNSETISCSDDMYAEDGCQYAYTMNVDDNFNVTIKNTNTTLATVMYNMVTANVLDNNTRIYVNYGGDIISSRWYGDIDYSKMKHDDLTIYNFEKTVIFTEEKNFESGRGNNNPVTNIVDNYSGDYAIALDVKPRQVTELREKGKITIADYTGYNFALGNNILLNDDNMLSVSVGINGISLIANSVINLKATTSIPLTLPYYNQEIERIGENGETYMDSIGIQRKITDYQTISLNYASQGKVKVELKGNPGVDDYTGYILLEDENNLLDGLSETIENPTVGSINGSSGQLANRGTNVNYKINITNSAITIAAYKYVSNESTILSYPLKIDDYINLKIEVKEKEDDTYVALLYVDGELLEESIPMYTMPKINVVGMTCIGNETRYFEGYIKNVVLYN